MTRVWSNGRATLYKADARAIPLPDKSVHCIVTSPPYWGLRDYGLSEWEGGDPECSHTIRNPNTPRQTISGSSKVHDPGLQVFAGDCRRCGATQTAKGIGLESTLAEWIQNIVAVFRELKRVLRDDGSVWLNLGDAYYGGKGQNSYRYVSTHLDRDTLQREYTNVSHTRVLDLPQDGLKAKSLIGMPWRVAFALQDDGVDVGALRVIQRTIDEFHAAFEGEAMPPKAMAILNRLYSEYAEAKGDSWYLRSSIIWHKTNPMPESTKDRPGTSHEYIFLLTKKPKYFYDAEAVRQPGKIHNGQAGTFSRSGSVSEHIIPGQSAAEHRPRTDRVPSGVNLRTVWTFATQPYKGAHFATFPEELPRRCILAGTSEKGVCAGCGAPWKRILNVSGGTIGTSWHDHSDDREQGQGQQSPFGGDMSKVDYGAGVYRRETLGWEPTCKCGPDADIIPALVLDPFSGSGTTLSVAQSLGRWSVGLDLNEEYLTLAQKRISTPIKTK